MTGSIQIINGNIQIQVAEYKPITLHSMHWLIAAIRNLFACLFPCCCHSAVKVKMGDTVAYLSSAELNKKLKHSGKDALEEAQLKQIALNAFSAETPPTDSQLQTAKTKPEPSSSQWHTVGKMSELSDISAETARLTTEFMQKRDQILKTNPHSGYQVYFTQAPGDDKMHVEIHPKGYRGGETQIHMPPKSAKESADGFETTRQLGISLCKELSELIAQYDMYAIFSNSDNILIIPDSSKASIEPDAFPHIFHLNQTQLQSVIAANLTAEAFLRRAFPTYKNNCFCFHVGMAGLQTESVLHGRHTDLPAVIKFNSQNGHKYIHSFVITRTRTDCYPPRYGCDLTFTDNTNEYVYLSPDEIADCLKKIPTHKVSDRRSNKES